MWVKREVIRTDIRDSNLLELLKYHQEAEWKALDRFGQHTNIFAGGMVALLAAGGASLAATSDKIKIVAFFIPLFVLYLRRFAIETLDRYYQRFLEAVVGTAKIEFLLGLHRPLWPVDRRPEIDVATVGLFPNDRTVDVDRRLISCIGKDLVESSNKWVYSFMSKGHNDVAWRLFKSICAGSFLILILAVAVFWEERSCGLFSVTALKTNYRPLSGAFLVMAMGTFLYRRHSNQILRKREKEGKLQNRGL